MKKVVGGVLALLLALSVPAAWAEEIQGKIQRVEYSDRAFVLEDGTMLWLAEGVSTADLKQGASVKATYEERDGKKVVTGFQVSE